MFSGSVVSLVKKCGVGVVSSYCSWTWWQEKMKTLESVIFFLWEREWEGERQHIVHRGYCIYCQRWRHLHDKWCAHIRSTCDVWEGLVRIFQEVCTVLWSIKCQVTFPLLLKPWENKQMLPLQQSVKASNFNNQAPWLHMVQNVGETYLSHFFLNEWITPHKSW